MELSVYIKTDEAGVPTHLSAVGEVGGDRVRFDEPDTVLLVALGEIFKAKAARLAKANTHE